MKTHTLYISDLDGTLLDQSACISEYTKRTLNLMIDKGMRFSVATARLLAPVRKMLDGLKINTPVILMNGVLIYDFIQQKFVKTNYLSIESVQMVIDIINQYDITGFMYELKNDEIITYHETSKHRTVHKYLLDRINRYQSILPKNGLMSVDKSNIIYFTLIDTKDRLEPIYNAFSKIDSFNQSFYKNVYNPDFWFLEIYSSESSKQQAVNFLVENYGFRKVVSFGDNHNDLPMFQASDVCIAVENATTDVKNVADYICESNINDGVAKWLVENFEF